MHKRSGPFKIPQEIDWKPCRMRGITNYEDIWRIPARIDLFKINKGPKKTISEICSMLTIKTQEQRQWSSSGAFIANFNRFYTSFWCFHCWTWTSSCKLIHQKQSFSDYKPKISLIMGLQQTYPCLCLIGPFNLEYFAK